MRAIMSEPENHTLRVLIEFCNEFRNEFAAFRSDFAEFKSATEQRFARIEKSLENLNQSFAGLAVGNQFLAGGFQGRFEKLERRVTALEQSR